MPQDYRYRPHEHIRKTPDFQRVFDEGRKYAAGPLLVRVLANELDVQRLGLVVGRKQGKAPLRNRLRRLIREGFRLEKHAWPEPAGGRGLDLVVSLRRGAVLDLPSVRRALTSAVRKFGEEGGSGGASRRPPGEAPA